MLRIVADVGNSRLKWGRLDQSGGLAEAIALPLDDLRHWSKAWEKWSIAGGTTSAWAISSVNPPVADRLERFLDGLADAKATWFRSAADVPVRHALAEPRLTGADRALAVAAALGQAPAGEPGIVISCGTAITVERITGQGIWQGGTIAPGLGLMARALHDHTAQLPLVEIHQAPPVWGASTRPAVEAGVFWGAAGAVREIVDRQKADLGLDPWLIWTGGDAELLARAVAGASARIEPDLVLIGLSRVIGWSA